MKILKIINRGNSGSIMVRTGGGVTEVRYQSPETAEQAMEKFYKTFKKPGAAASKQEAVQSARISNTVSSVQSAPQKSMINKTVQNNQRGSK